MENRIITIENGIVSVPQSGNIRMTVFEICRLFDVYVQTVKSNIKAILKSGIIQVNGPFPATVSGKTIIPDLYGLDMVITLAFRVQSPQTVIFREWIVSKASKMELPKMLKTSIQNPVLN